MSYYSDSRWVGTGEGWMVGWKSLTWRWCWSKHCYSHSIDDREEEDDDDDVLATTRAPF